MGKYNIVEKFVSINGEGSLAGAPAVFIRFKGCNLACPYCDTKWANKADAPCEVMTEEQIYSYIKNTGIKYVTLTGGEPLIQEDIADLIGLLACDRSLHIEIETNGSADISGFCGIENRPSFTLDYKTPSSLCEDRMLLSNYGYIDERDTLKFVCGSHADLEKAREIIQKYNPQCNILISPIYGCIEPYEIADFIIKNKMNSARLQLQLHKIVWSPDKRGV